MNEESSKGAGQIEEFLMAYNGEGIQHIAMETDDLLATWDKLKARGTANRSKNCKAGAYCSMAIPAMMNPDYCCRYSPKP